MDDSNASRRDVETPETAAGTDRPSATRSQRRLRSKPLATFGVFATAVALVVVARFVTIPGVDVAELVATLGPVRPSFRRTVAAWQTREFISPITAAISSLILVRPFVALATRRRKRPEKPGDMPFAAPAEDRGRARHRAERIGALVYLLFVALSGAGVALYTSTLRGRDPNSLIVANANVPFLVGAIALEVAAGCVVWMVSNAITRTRVVHGPLALAGSIALVHGTIELLDAGAHAAFADIWARESLVPLAALIPTLMLCVFVSRRPRWLFDPDADGVRAISSFDVVLAPTAVVYLVSNALQLARLAQHSFVVSAPANHVTLAIECVFALALGIMLLRTPRRSRSSNAWALAAPLVVVAAFAVIVVGVICEGGNAHGFVVRGLIHGGWRYRIWFGTNDDTDPADVSEIRRRLSHANLELISSEPTPNGVMLFVRSRWRVSASTLDRLRTRRHMEIAWVANGGRALQTDHISSERTARDMRERLALYFPGADLRTAIDCHGSGEWPCSAWLLERPPILTRADVASAQAQLHADTGAPYVAVVLTDDAADRFAVATTDGVGRYLAITIDDEILIRPVVNEPIRNGSIAIGLAHEGNYEDAVEIAATFGGELRGEWFVERYEPVE